MVNLTCEGDSSPFFLGINYVIIVASRILKKVVTIKQGG